MNRTNLDPDNMKQNCYTEYYDQENVNNLIEKAC